MSLSWKKEVRRALVVVLCELMVLWPAYAAPKPAGRHASVIEPLPLEDYLTRSYLTLFQLSPELHFTQAQFQAELNRLQKNQQNCETKFKKKVSDLNHEISLEQKELRKKDLSSAKRHALHCKVQNLKYQKTQEMLLARHGIPVAYQNLKAKLELIQYWPTEYKQVQKELADGVYRQRRWGDVKDIGFRSVAPGQANDIKTGLEAMKQMKQEGVLPPELKDPAIVNYVKEVAHRVASHSDLQVPLHVYVLNSKTINAFSLPGGYLFVDRGLLQAADDEAELAGVLGHEIAHICARHGHKLMERATIASLLYQAAEVAGIMLTGGIASIGTYYALEYGFQGLGLLLNLKLLGVSRQYELQADQLGIQYAWNAGYDPTGFIRFFDKMATKVGYVNGMDWFYDHPPFYERMVDAEREIDFLPKRPEYVVQTSAFLQMKKELAPVIAKATRENMYKPSLVPHEKGCEAPPKIHFQPGQNVDDICGPAPSAASSVKTAKK